MFCYQKRSFIRHNEASQMHIGDQYMEEEDWSAWIEARYALSDLYDAEGRIVLAPEIANKLRAAIDKVAEAIEFQLTELKLRYQETGGK